MARILVDLDGPTYPFGDCAKNYIDFNHPDRWDTTGGWHEYSMYRLWGMTDAEFLDVMIEAVRGGHLYRSLPPRGNAREVLTKLREDGHTIVIVTARSYDPEADQAATRWWLEQYEIPFDELHFSSDKTLFDCKYAIEDYTKNALALFEAGVCTYVFDLPWNQDWTGKRVYTWDAFYNAITIEERFPTPVKADKITQANVVGLAGYAGAGKDTVGAILIEKYGFERISFADPLRNAVATLNPIVGFEDVPGTRGEFSTRLVRYNEALDRIGYTEAKVRYPEVREILQRMGTDVGREQIDPDLWVNLAMKSMDPTKRYVITDMRFPNEAAAVSNAGGLLVRVRRDGYGPVNDHPSETAIDDVAYDLYIDNNGTLDDLAAIVES